MALNPLFHVAWLSRATAIEPCPITPFHVQCDSVRWVGNQQRRLAAVERASDIRRVQATAA